MLPTTVLMWGLTRSYFTWTSRVGPQWWRGFRPTISARQANCGGIPFIAGTFWLIVATGGGSIDFAHRFTCSISSGSITFEASRPIGKFLQALQPQSAENG